mmetsp:Transcript_26144/g.42630  ORF Transcript_26144/g.42630 Transcript_26144/m.42630 type:complete len:367 (+) Transcript_26144:159-1259(+)
MGVKKVGKYEIGKTIGEGTFGKVKSAINTETGEQVALKVLDKSAIQKQNMGPQIKKEISIMKMVSHPHVVRLIEVLASRTKIFIVLEMVTGGELFDKIVAEGRFSEDKARFYFRQLLAGVEYCHARGVCHRDLKPENLLLDENGNLKISDFGLSALYSGGTDEGMKLLHTTCGTPNYVAPEVLADQGYDGRKADLWSCGVILYVLLAGFLPFDENSMSALFKKIQAADFSYPRWFSQEVRGLLDRIMTVDVNKRLTIPQMKEDPWITLNGTLAWPEVDPHGSGGGGGGGQRPVRLGRRGSARDGLAAEGVHAGPAQDRGHGHHDLEEGAAGVRGALRGLPGGAEGRPSGAAHQLYSRDTANTGPRR